MKRIGIIAVAVMSLVAAGGCDANIPQGSTLPVVDPNHDPRWTIYKDAFSLRVIQRC